MSDADAQNETVGKDTASISQSRSPLKTVLYSAFFVVLIGFFVNVFFAWMYGVDVESQLEAIRESGEPTSYEELFNQEVPDDDNAAVLLDQIATQATALAKYIEDYSTSTEASSLRASAGQLKKLNAAFSNHEATIGVFRDAFRLEHFVPNESSLMTPEGQAEHIDRLRNIAKALRARYAMYATEGNTEHAFEAALDQLSFARLVETDGMLLGFIAALAFRSQGLESADDLLQNHRLTPEQHRRLDEHLARFDDSTALKVGMYGERVFGIRQFRAGEHYNKDTTRGNIEAMLVWPVRRQFLQYLVRITELIKLNEKPFAEVAGPLRARIKQAPKGNHDHQALTAYLAARLGLQRRVAYTRCVRVLNAIKQTYPEGAPENLDLAILGLDPEVIQDPFGDGLLKYRQSPDGPVVYSIGPNGRDDQDNPQRKSNADIEAGISIGSR